MLIYAIGIYSSHDLKRLKAVSHTRGFFSRNSEDPLKNIEAYTLSLVNAERKQGFLQAECRGEYHYLQCSEAHQVIMAICCRQKLEIRELYFLFRNIQHAYLGRSEGRYVMDDIISNPLGFSNKDRGITDVQDELNLVKQQLITVTLPLALQRGEQLERIAEQTVKLQLESERFKREAKKANPCCSMF